MPTLEFIEPGHRYRVDGVEVPGVTQVIRAAGLMPDLSFLDPWYLERGTAIHLACQLHDEGDLNPDSIDPAIAGYVQAWRNFRESVGAELAFTGIEQRGYNAAYRYAGTIDRAGTWRGQPMVMDLKTSAKAEPWMGLQLASYAHLLDPVPAVRLGVHLDADGGWRMEKYEDRSDWPTFAAAVGLFHWRTAHGLL